MFTTKLRKYAVAAITAVGVLAIGSAAGAATPAGSLPASDTSNQPYWTVASDGGVFAFGGGHFYGSMGGSHINKPMVGIAPTADGQGYWTVASDGGVFSFGDASFYGSMGGSHINKPMVGMAATPTGKGYWTVASDGGVFSYGDAQFYGSTGGITLNKPVVGMATTPDGKGYWLVASDGGIFSYGDASFYGSAGSINLNSPIVGISATPTGKGYWSVASDGGIFSYGDASFYGSGLGSSADVVGMAATAQGDGYWIANAAGANASRGSASPSALGTLNAPIVGIGTIPGGLPIAADDAYGTPSNTTLNVTAAGVLANDSSPAGRGLSSVLDSSTTHGTLSLSANGAFTYTPANNYLGTDSFTYHASDGFRSSIVRTATITVSPQAPVARDDSYATNSNTTLTVAAPGIQSNDTDPQALSTSSYEGAAPSHGTVTVATDGSITYTPDANYVGDDSFTYYLRNAYLVSNTATVTISVNAQAPVANDDSATTNSNTDATGNVLTNDTDPQASPLTASLVSNPTFGTVQLNSDGSFDYTPDANYVGDDSFTYMVSDQYGNGNVATVSITVNPVAPTANDDSFSGPSNTDVTGNVLSNDTDPQASPLTASLLSAPSNGSVVVNSDGSFDYTPTTDFVGNDSFTYTATDGYGLTSTATVSIEIDAQNPVAVADSYSTDSNTTLTVTAPGVLGNDYDPQNSAISEDNVTSGPTNGSATVNADGSFTYTPNANFVGDDSFTYEIVNGYGLTATATATITVNPVAPTANDDSATTNSNTDVTGNVLSNDTDPQGSALTATIVDQPTNGSVVLNSDGSYDYTPNTDFVGSDSFTYQAVNGYGQNSNTATVSITVNAQAPVAADDSYDTNSNTTLTVDAASGVLANDTDPQNSTLSATLSSAPSNGSVVLNSDGSFTYTPAIDYVGPDSFTYTVSDAYGNGNDATVTVSINAQAPSTVDDSFSGPSNTDITGNALSNDTDPQNSALTAAVDAAPSNGNVTVNSDGSFDYTPNTDFVGSDSFTYTATNGYGLSSDSTVNLTINAQNPVANADSASGNSNTDITGNVLTNDTDPQNSPLSASLSSAASNGTATVNADGSFTYTPNTDFVGSDSFTYTATNGYGLTDDATVSITVNAQAPVAADDSFSGPSNTDITGNVLSNDTDPQNSALTAAVATGPSSGNVTVNSDGSFDYTPNKDFVGSDSFTYTATNAYGVSDDATVSLTVNAQAPTANDDSVTTNSNTDATGNVLANDTDPQNSALTAAIVDQPTNGSVVLNSDGSYDYTPATDFVGSDSFTYTATNAYGQASNTATVSITINAQAPNAVDDSFSGPSNTDVTGNVLSNDTDPQNSALTATGATVPSNGAVVLSADGSFTYTPNTDFVGSDSFTYTTTNSYGLTDDATVSITINAQAPTVTDHYNTTWANQPFGAGAPALASGASDPQNETLTYSVVSGTSHGTVTVNSDGTWTYNSDTNYVGPDSFTYKATNSSGVDSNTGNEFINVVPVAPTANDDSFSGPSNTDVTGNVMTNDTDPQGSALTASLVTGPSSGNVTLNSDGSFTYTPNTDFTGNDTFTYKDTNGYGQDSNTATATITITAQAPTVADHYNSTTANQPFGAGAPALASGASDPQNEALTYSVVSGTSHGSVTVNSDGTWSYTSDTDYVGSDSFTYKATNSDGVDSNTGNEFINVNAQAPTANDDTAATTVNTDATGNVLSNDTDPQNSALTASLVTGPGSGNVILNSDGSYDYTPNAGFTGTDTFTYTATNAYGKVSGTATVTITVS